MISFSTLNNEKGFTLIEIIAVIIMLGIFAVVASTRFTDPAVYTAKAEYDTLVSHIRYTQMQAINKRAVWRIDFSGSSYALVEDETETSFPFPSGTDPVALNELGVPSGTSIRFDRKGRLVTGSHVDDKDQVEFITNNINISCSGYNQDISIEGYTGFIH
jgi:prepilin-type N-terminal cleavage/methylation domain-containing protein